MSASLWQNPKVFNECFWRLILYLLEMIMLICLGGTLTQTKRTVGKEIFLSKGPIWGQYVFLIANYHICIDTLYMYFKYYFWRHSLLFLRTSYN